jgi:hypothetical protein
MLPQYMVARMSKLNNHLELVVIFDTLQYILIKIAKNRPQATHFTFGIGLRGPAGPAETLASDV